MATLKQVNLNDLDFAIPTGIRRSRESLADICISIRVRGKGRKCDGHAIIMTTFMKRQKNKYKHLSVGTLNFRDGHKQVYVVFDRQGSASNIIYTKNSDLVSVSSKGLCYKLFEAFGVELPKLAGATTRLYFDCETIVGQPKVFAAMPVCVEQISPSGEGTLIDLKRDNGEKKSDG